MDTAEERATVILKIPENDLLRVWQQATAKGMSLTYFIITSIMDRTVRGERLEEEAEVAVKELIGG